MTNKKQQKKISTVLCPKCESFVFGLLNELRNNAQEHNRGGLIIDAITDLQASLEAGNIKEVQLRDEQWVSGNKTPRRLR
jgi:hypothetical protein